MPLTAAFVQIGPRIKFDTWQSVPDGSARQAPERTLKYSFTQPKMDPKSDTLNWLYSLDGRGEIYFAGRNDFQIKHMGYRIELGEIETAAMGVPDVRNACVIYDSAKSQIVLFYQADAELGTAVLRKSLE